MNNCKWSTCQESFNSSKGLFDHICESHINVMGTQKFTRECKWDNCDAKVERRHHLVSHIRIHVNFKPFVCQYCGKSYKWAHDSKRHVRKCNSNPDMKGPLSAPPSMSGLSPYSATSSQMMSPIDFMRSPLDQNWSRSQFPLLNFQNISLSNRQMMMPSPTTPPNMSSLLQQQQQSYNDESSQSDFDYQSQQHSLSLQIPQQKFESVNFF